MPIKSQFTYSGTAYPSRNRFGNSAQILDNQSNLYTQYGFDRGGNNELGPAFRAFGAYQYGPAASRMAYNANLEGGYQKTLDGILKRLTNNAGHYATQGQRGANRLSAMYGRAQGLADQSARAQGLGTGTQLGASQGLSQNAARAASAAEEKWLDPRRKTEDMMQAAALMEQAMQSNPYLAQMMQLFAPIEQRHQQNQSERGNGFLGDLVSDLVGSAAKQYGANVGAQLSNRKWWKQR